MSVPIDHPVLPTLFRGPISACRARAEEKFRSAILRLQDSIPLQTTERLGQIRFPNFDDVKGVENKTAAELEVALEQLIQERSKVKTEGRKNKVKTLMLTWFRATYPFANPFLVVAQEGSAVCSP